MYTSIRRGAIYTFIAGLIICTFVVILGIWIGFEDQVFLKSLQSVVILSVSGLLVAGVSYIREREDMPAALQTPGQPHHDDFSFGTFILLVLLFVVGIPFLFLLLAGM